MTDEEAIKGLKRLAKVFRREAICAVANVDDIGDLSDGFHTFNGLYNQRMILFAALVKAYKEKAWKSYRHEDGEYCFGGGWFIVGIDTPEGSYTYHYEDNYFSLFDCKELERGKHWDGHTEKDVHRLLSLSSAYQLVDREGLRMVDLVSRQKVLRCIKESRENIDWGQSEDGDAFLHYSAALYRTIASKECLPSVGRSTTCDDIPSTEIIRCKDCKYNATSKKCLQPDSFFLVPADDFYCGYAERKSDSSKDI